MREDLRDLIERLQITTLFVTHDQEEALAMAHRIVIMNNGTIEQIGSPSEVYDAPKTEFVAQFMGRCNFIKVDAIENERVAVLRGGHRIEVANPVADGEMVAIRPHNVLLSAVPGACQFTGRLVKSLYLGPISHLTIDFGAFALLVDVSSEKARQHEVGASVTVYVEPRNVRLLNGARV